MNVRSQFPSFIRALGKKTAATQAAGCVCFKNTSSAMSALKILGSVQTFIYQIIKSVTVPAFVFRYRNQAAGAMLN